MSPAPESVAAAPTPASAGEVAAASGAAEQQRRAQPRGSRPRGDNPVVGRAEPRGSWGGSNDYPRGRYPSRIYSSRGGYYNRYYHHYYYPRHVYPYGYGAFGLGYFYYDPFLWYPHDPFWSSPYYGAYPYGAYPYGASAYGASYGRYTAEGYYTGELRLIVHPRDAEVYVDGYFAGNVDDFDGVFQALRLEEGAHKIEVVYPGHETLVFDVRIEPGRKVTYRGELRPRP